MVGVNVATVTPVTRSLPSTPARRSACDRYSGSAAFGSFGMAIRQFYSWRLAKARHCPPRALRAAAYSPRKIHDRSSGRRSRLDQLLCSPQPRSAVRRPNFATASVWVNIPAGRGLSPRGESTVTTMTFTLSPTLLSELQNAPGVLNNGVYLYAFAFGNPDPSNASSTVQLMNSTALIKGGVVQTGANILGLNQPGVTDFASGNVIVVLQQTGPGGTSDLPAKVTANGIGYLLDPGNAASKNFRYDAIEATIEGQSTDAADLTNV